MSGESLRSLNLGVEMEAGERGQARHTQHPWANELGKLKMTNAATGCLRLCQARTLYDGLSVPRVSPHGHEAGEAVAPPPGAQPEAHHEAEEGEHRGDDYHGPGPGGLQSPERWGRLRLILIGQEDDILDKELSRGRWWQTYLDLRAHSPHERVNDIVLTVRYNLAAQHRKFDVNISGPCPRNVNIAAILFLKG